MMRWHIIGLAGELWVTDPRDIPAAIRSVCGGEPVRIERVR